MSSLLYLLMSEMFIDVEFVTSEIKHSRRPVAKDH